MDANQDNAPNTKAATIISKEMPEEHVTLVFKFLTASGYSGELPEGCSAMDFFSDLIRGLLKVDCITRGRITCSFSVKPAIANYFKGLHGGVVAAIAERVAVACARTVVAEDKELFLGELNMSYLSAAPLNVELVADGSLVRSGRNITVISIEFRLKKTGKLVYTANATFFNLPSSKL